METGAASASICRSARPTVLRRSATNMTAMKKPPQPQHLTTEEAAARERTYQTLHDKAMGGPHGAHHAHSMEASTKQDTP